MSEIFSGATHVRVYVGEPADDTESAMLLIRECTRFYSNQQVKNGILEDETGSIALTELLHRPYWRRMWIFQEIVLGKDVVIHCGQFQASWSGLLKLDAASGDGRLWYENQIRAGWVFELRKALFRVSQFCIERSQAVYPTNVLLPTRTLQATDPRDKLFALLGVSDFGNTLKADYAKSIRDVYLDFAGGYMGKEKSLDLLLTAGLCQMNNGPDIDLPSWTPDFRGLKGDDVQYVAASYLSSCSAAGSRTSSFSITSDGRMETQAIIVDEISQTVPLEHGEDCRAKILSILSHRKLSRARRNILYRHFFETMVFYDKGFQVSEDNSRTIRERKEERLKRLVFGFTHDWVSLLVTLCFSETSMNFWYPLSHMD